MNAADALLASALGDGDRPAILAGERQISYAELAAAACRCGHVFRDLGVGAQDRVLLMVDDTPEFFFAYLGDLRAVLDAPLRDAPGIGLSQILISPAYLAMTLTALFGAWFLRRSGRDAEGLSVLLLLPAFVLVTWQNFGNVPVWLLLLAALLAVGLAAA